MKKFLLRFAVYLIPLPVYLGLVLLIDPFNYAGVSRWISDDVKVNTSEVLHPWLWNMLQFKNQTSARIILGDSRAAKVRAYHVKELTGKDFYNFSYAGGTLIDMIETFWYADSLVKLEEVYMGISFNMYNDFEKNNNVRQAGTIMKSYISYAFSEVVFKAMIQNVKNQFFVRDLEIAVPNMDFDAFWAYEIDVIARRYYQKYRHPDFYYAELKKISAYCRANDIKLVFFIPPNHVDWQRRAADFGLEEEHRLFLSEIGALGTLYNLDTANEFTRNKNNFLDPVHPVNDSLIVHTLWGNVPE